jgi:endonuclease/exonuclease/phosphatase (EEP) superfamily protein YafD
MTENEQVSGFGQQLLARLGKLSLAAIDLYAAGIVLYLLLRILTGYRLWPLALMSNFLHWLLLPAFILLPIIVWQRRWPTSGMLAAGVIAFIWLFGGLFLPQSIIQTAHASSDQTLTMMTLNANDDNAPPDELISLLRDSGADIVALQEVGPGQAAALDENLLDEYPYRDYGGYGIPGIGLLSRYPIVEHQIVVDETTFPYLIATLSVDGRELTAISAHPPPPRWVGLQDYQSTGIMEISYFADLATIGDPTILMGDFNAVDQSVDYRLLADAGLHDAFREAGWGFGLTWPDYSALPWLQDPVIRIDYIWHTGHFEAQQAWVGPSTGSDHRAVIAQLYWPVETID